MTQHQKECGCWLGLHGCLRFHQEPLHAAGEHLDALWPARSSLGCSTIFTTCILGS
jgi:hypothetical protein